MSKSHQPNTASRDVLLDKVKGEAIAEWCQQTVNKHIDPTFKTIDLYAVAENVLEQAGYKEEHGS